MNENMKTAVCRFFTNLDVLTFALTFLKLLRIFSRVHPILSAMSHWVLLSTYLFLMISCSLFVSLEINCSKVYIVPFSSS